MHFQDPLLSNWQEYSRCCISQLSVSNCCQNGFWTNQTRFNKEIDWLINDYWKIDYHVLFCLIKQQQKYNRNSRRDLLCVTQNLECTISVDTRQQWREWYGLGPIARIPRAWSVSKKNGPSLAPGQENPRVADHASPAFGTHLPVRWRSSATFIGTFLTSSWKKSKCDRLKEEAWVPPRDLNQKTTSRFHVARNVVKGGQVSLDKWTYSEEALKQCVFSNLYLPLATICKQQLPDTTTRN